MESRIVFSCIAVVVAEIMLGMVTPLFLRLSALLSQVDLFMVLTVTALIVGVAGLVGLLITTPVGRSVYWQRSAPYRPRIM